MSTRLNTRRPSLEKDRKERLLQELRGEREILKRLNVDIEASLYKRIKARAVEEERTISDITREMWIEYLNK